jgi:hypothetical protein
VQWPDSWVPLFVADRLGTSCAIVDVVSDADHSLRGRVVSRRGLYRPRAPQAAQNLNGGDGPGC